MALPYKSLTTTPYQDPQGFSQAVSFKVPSGQQSPDVYSEQTQEMSKSIQSNNKSSFSRRRSSSAKDIQVQAEQVYPSSPAKTIVSPSPVSSINSPSPEVVINYDRTMEFKKPYYAPGRKVSEQETSTPSYVTEEKISRQPSEVRSDMPKTNAEKINRLFGEARQKTKDVFLTDTEFKKVSVSDFGNLGKVAGLGVASVGYYGGRGVVSAVKDIGTGQIIPKTTSFLTEVVTNPIGLGRDIKREFLVNPPGFLAEQVSYGIVTGKVFKGIKTKEILEVPISPAYNVPKPGSARLFVQNLKPVSLFSEGLGVLQNVKFEDLEGLGLGKKGSLSKAELRFKSRTGYTKAQIRKGEKPSQSGTMTQTFYSKDIKANQGLQSRIANLPYPEDINTGKYKKFSLVKDSQSNKDVAFTLQSKRTGYNIPANEVYKDVSKSSSQVTTKDVTSYGKTSELISLQTGKVKIEYKYPKKPTLNPKKPEAKKFTPFSQTIELVTNVNEKGQEVFASATEPLVNVVKGFRPGTKSSLMERVKVLNEKREAQLKEIESKKNNNQQQYQNKVPTQELFMSLESKKKFVDSSNVNPTIVYAPKVSIEQLSRTKSFTNSLPASTPGLELGYKPSEVVAVAKAESIYGGKLAYSPSLVFEGQSSQLQSPSLIQGMSMDYGLKMDMALKEDVVLKQDIAQDIALREDIGYVQDIPNPLIVVFKPDVSRVRNQDGNRPRPSKPITPNPPRFDEFVNPRPKPETPKRYTPKVPKPKKPEDIGYPNFKSREYNDFGFIGQVRKEGRFVSVTSPGSFSDVFSRASGLARGTSSASFRVIGRSGVVSNFAGSDNVFYRSGREKGVFVERSKYRINTPGEISEISFKGIGVQKRKKGFGFGGMKFGF